MWCTRWYLPLLLLPIPIAPPYFLLLFLFSTTMHARPCFYCMVMLTAMFMSTCYWPPQPIETSLVKPWSETITTFADALHSVMPNIPEDRFPSTILVAERCWCDLSNGFFAPYNTTRWEEFSVVRLKDRLEKEIAAEQMEKTGECEAVEGEEPACGIPEEEEVKPAPSSSVLEDIWGKHTLLELLWNAVTSIRRRRNPPTSFVEEAQTETESTDNFEEIYEEEGEDEPFPPKTTSPTHKPTTISSPPPTSSWLRREYDLRQFGFAMVLDFGWPNSNS